MFDDCVTKTMPFNAESHEEKDGSKQYLNDGLVIQAVFQLDAVKNTEKKQNPKILTLLKKGVFPASFDDLDHQNRDFMVSNTIFINFFIIGLELGNFFSRYAL